MVSSQRELATYECLDLSCIDSKQMAADTWHMSCCYCNSQQTAQVAKLKQSSQEARRWLPPASVHMCFLVGLSRSVDDQQNTQDCSVGEVTHSLHGEGHDHLHIHHNSVSWQQTTNLAAHEW